MAGIRFVLTAAIVAALVAASTVADARHRKWRAPHKPVAHAQPGTFSYGPARMIEIKPGLYISSYGCVTDEGNGRYVPCGAGRSD